MPRNGADAPSSDAPGGTSGLERQLSPPASGEPDRGFVLDVLIAAFFGVVTAILVPAIADSRRLRRQLKKSRRFVKLATLVAADGTTSASQTPLPESSDSDAGHFATPTTSDISQGESNADSLQFLAESGSIIMPFPSQRYRLRRVHEKYGLYYLDSIDHITPLDLRLPTTSNRAQSEMRRLHGDLTHYLELNRSKLGESNIRDRFTIELRWAGVADGHQIELRPTIWVKCEGRQVKGLVEGVLANPTLAWAASYNMQVQDSLVLTTTPSAVRIASLDPGRGGFRFHDSLRVHLHLQEPEDGVSACGLLFCTTITHAGVVIDQRLSRLGGLLELGGEAIYATSTAHGIIDALLRCARITSKSQARRGPTEAGAKLELLSISGGDWESEIDSADDNTASQNPMAFWGLIDALHITKWRSIAEIRALGFVTPAIASRHGQTWKLGAQSWAHDLVLLGVWDGLRNTYLQDGSRHFIQGYLKDQELPAAEEDVTILLGGGTNPAGRIQPGLATISVAGVVFNTRRVLLFRPLGRCFMFLNPLVCENTLRHLLTGGPRAAPGTSGSWVVFKGQLCGAIAASSFPEPIAYMTTAETLMRDIRISLSLGTDVGKRSSHL